MVRDFLSKIEKEVWSRDDYYICYFGLCEGGRITLDKCNPTYMRFNGLKHCDIGKPVEDLFPESYVFSLKTTYRKIRTIPDCITYIREVNSFYWETNVYFEDQKLKAVSRRITNFSSEKFSDRFLNHFNFNKLRERNNHTIILRSLPDSTYSVESYSKNLDRALGIKLHQIENFNQVLDKSCLWIKSTAIFDECIDTNQPLRLIEMFNNNGTYLYIFVTVYPLICGNEKKIILTGCKLSEDEYFQMQQKQVDIFEDLFENQFMGMSLIMLDERFSDRKPYVLKSNPYFDRLLEERLIGLNQLISSSVIQNCIQNNTISASTVSLPVSSGRTGRFFLCAIPTINSNRFFIAISPKEKVAGSANIIFSALTQREHEVVNYVVDGRTNKQIASVLDISEGTVKKIIYNAYQKLHITSRIDLIKLVLNF